MTCAAGGHTALRGPESSRPATLAALVAILTMALALRLHHIDFGLPHTANFDERLFVERGIRVAREFDPGWYNHPAATLHLLLAAAYRTAHAIARLRGGPADFARWLDGVAARPRWIITLSRVGCACVDALTVLAVFALVRRLGWPRPQALGAAALYATSAGAIAMSHIVRSDHLLTLLMVLHARTLLDVLECGRGRDYLVAGVVTGLLVATKWPAVVVAVPIVMAHVVAGPVAGGPVGRSWAWTAAVVLAAAGATLIVAGGQVSLDGLLALPATPDKPIWPEAVTFFRRTLTVAGLGLALAGLAVPLWPWWARAARGVVSDARMYAALGGGALAFGAVAPLALVRWPQVVVDIACEARPRPPFDGEPGPGNLLYYLGGPIARDLTPVGLALALLGIVSIVRASCQRPGEGPGVDAPQAASPTSRAPGAPGADLSRGHPLAGGIAVSGAMLYLLYIAMGPIRWPHYALPLSPFLAVLAARGIGGVVGRLPGRILRAVVASLLVIVGLPQAVGVAAAFGRRQTAVEATDWMARLVRESGMIRVLTETHEVGFPPGSCDVQGVWSVVGVDPRRIERGEWDYVVLSSTYYEEFLRRADRYPVHSRRYVDILARMKPVKVFDGRAPGASGPTILVYRFERAARSRR